MGDVGVGMVGIELGERLREVGGGDLPVAGIEPEVRVVGAGLGLGGDKAADDEAAVLDRFGKAVDQGALLAQGFKDGIELPFQMQAAVDDHIGGVHGADVGLGGLVEMGVDAGAHEGRDLDGGDAGGEDPGQVAGLGGGGDDAEGAVGAYACGCGGVRLGLLFGGGFDDGWLSVTAAGCDKECGE